ncbi:hypothetical protein [Echinimonas agarilytica]|uniref:SatD family (SatD) n=1 Tax=Echinimonas agarilytica TaxID=1215918 RepID=A0AA41W7K9_9GAMM|nr:hypothetical protein [Echinimonas agarilytica]MCM2680464.1 hypothetical protein [Echinimonas agarilytica]
MQNVAVVTGDLVNSRAIPPDHYDQVRYVLNAQLADWTERDGDSHEFFGGDSFQAVILTPESAMRKSLLLRLALHSEAIGERKQDIRLSIGLGKVDAIRTHTASSTGKAFELSGLGIKNLKQQRLGIFSDNPTFQLIFELLTRFVDARLQENTAKQSEALYHFIASNFQSHDIIANKLQTSRSNVSKLLRRSHATLIADYIKLYEQQVRKEFG